VTEIEAMPKIGFDDKQGEKRGGQPTKRRRELFVSSDLTPHIIILYFRDVLNAYLAIV
jgi:hypothetical protein